MITEAKSNSIHSKIIIFMFCPVTVSRGRLSSGPLQLILDRLCRVAALKWPVLGPESVT